MSEPALPEQSSNDTPSQSQQDGYGGAPAASGLALLSTVASNGSSFPSGNSVLPQAGVPSPLMTSPASQASPSSSMQALSYILNQPTVESSIASPQSFISRASTAFRPAHATHRSPLRPLFKKDDEMAFLLRHFSECPGHWMDLFDLGRFFEMEVPVKAARCPLLLYSALALSAKSLGRMDRSSKRRREAPIPHTNAEWLHRARTYYDKAIHCLRQALEAEVQSPNVSNHVSSPVSPLAYSEASQAMPGFNDDVLVGTTAILCVYEFLDASGEEWSRHLDGAKSLFDITKEGVLAMSPAPLERRNSFSKRRFVNSRVAIFWNLARQDMLDACKYELQRLVGHEH